MPSVSTTLPLIQTLYNKYKDSVESTDISPVASSQNTESPIVIPPSEMAELLHTATNNSIVSMFFSEIRGIL